MLFSITSKLALVSTLFSNAIATNNYEMGILFSHNHMGLSHDKSVMSYFSNDLALMMILCMTAN